MKYEAVTTIIVIMVWGRINVMVDIYYNDFGPLKVYAENIMIKFSFVKAPSGYKVANASERGTCRAGRSIRRESFMFQAKMLELWTKAKAVKTEGD